MVADLLGEKGATLPGRAFHLLYDGGVNERNALAIVDRDYGSLEDFAIAILSEKRDALDESLPLAKRAEVAGLPLPVFARVLATPQFRAMLRVDLVNEAYGIEAEREHVQRMVGVARGEEKKVMSPSGKIGHVDQAPGDVIAAGRYLNELRGTPIEKSQQSAPSVIINISRADAGEDDEDEATIDVDVVPHRPQRAGGLPPVGARTRFGATVRRDTPSEPEVDAGLGTLYGRRAEEEDEDQALAEKKARREERNDGEDEENGRPEGWWSRKWPSRRVPSKRHIAYLAEED